VPQNPYRNKYTKIEVDYHANGVYPRGHPTYNGSITRFFKKNNHKKAKQSGNYNVPKYPVSTPNNFERFSKKKNMVEPVKLNVKYYM